ncbi:hypothetical protein [Dactylosporangium sp. CA-092794]|uniref:hypothetical protein n=1 Tax=Dactylosporangium sp. CA-092794 TaxID=3239929 RepID=UPI003D8D775A
MSVSLAVTCVTVRSVRAQATDTETGAMIAKGAPGQIAVIGRLPGGAVAGLKTSGRACAPPCSSHRSTERDDLCGSLATSVCRSAQHWR